MISEILLKLSVKFIVKFSCICKSWCALIFSPEFVKWYIKISLQRNEAIKLSFGSYAKNRVIFHSCYANSFMNQTKCINFSMIFGAKMINSLKIIDSVNGLLCVLLKIRKIFLWNPILRNVWFNHQRGVRSQCEGIQHY